MDVSQTKLAKDQPNSSVVGSIKDLVAEADKLKAREGARRLIFICDNYDRLTPETAYRWLDPLAFQHEVEDARAQRVWGWHLLRNCVSILPLILTWLALFLALTAYQGDTYSGDAGKSFLQLWQEGFHGGTGLTFSMAAITDVGLLVFYLILIGVTSWTDGKAYARSTKFAATLQTTTEELMHTIANSPAISGDKSAIQNVAAAVQQVVDNAMKANKDMLAQIMADNKQALEGAVRLVQQLGQQFQNEFTQIAQDAKSIIAQVTQKSQQAIDDSNNRSDTFFRRVSGSVGTFETSVQNLETVLKNYQAKLDEIQDAIGKMTAASAGLASNAARYTQIGLDISKNTEILNKTMSSVLQQIGSVSQGITNAAAEMNKSSLNMEGAAKQVEKVATQLDSGIQSTLKTMYTEVTRSTNAMSAGVTQAARDLSRGAVNAADSLRDITPDLDRASTALQNTADQLSSIQFVGMNGHSPSHNSAGGGGGGVFGWAIRRRRNWRKQRQKQGQP